MREKNQPASLNELMGKGANKVTLENLHEHLGHKMPQIEYTDVGRMRLIHALQYRFGANFRQINGVPELLQQFDKEKKTREVIKANKEGR